ncbi:MAG TPA: hypothetical protein PK886_00960 [Candidatus Paceibacterota bacterium]|nr:hypothetical protein [Candidatus Paceibacterota bacterium]
METITVLFPEKVDLIIKDINKLVADKKYWIGSGSGKLDSAEDATVDWFRGVGTFERVVYLKAHEDKHGSGLVIIHLNAVDNSSVIPENCFASFGSEIRFVNNDLLIYEPKHMASPRGCTNIYMEWTKDRFEKYQQSEIKEEEVCIHRQQSRVITHRGQHCGDCGKRF